VTDGEESSHGDEDEGDHAGNEPAAALKVRGFEHALIVGCAEALWCQFLAYFFFDFFAS